MYVVYRICNGNQHTKVPNKNNRTCTIHTRHKIIRIPKWGRWEKGSSSWWQ